MSAERLNNTPRPNVVNTLRRTFVVSSSLLRQRLVTCPQRGHGVQPESN